MTETATVNVTINAVADIANDTQTTNEDTAVNVLVQGNDTFENANHAITGTTNGANGTVAVNNNGTAGDATDDFVVYTPNADFNGSDSFTYTVTSGGVTETATVNVTINAVADIANDTQTTNEDTAVNILVQGNDTFENANHAITGTTNGANGTVAVNNNGTAGDATDDFVVYTPNADFNGSDSFTYTVTSGGVTETATVNVTINAVADIANDTQTTNEDTAVNILVQANDTFENANHAITGTTNGANGTVAVNNNGTPGSAADDFVVYTPNLNFFGSDSFTYTITSGGVTETATVNVTINSINDVPQFAGLDNVPGYTENGAATVLDNNATVSDVELDALNAGTGNYNGAVLTLARNGGPNAQDEFGTTGTLSFSGGNVLVGATTVGTFTNANGQLQITFNANATSALADSVLQQITYLNNSEDPPLSVQINYSLNDGNTGSQGGGPTPGIGIGSITVSITPINDRPEIAGVAANASYTIGATGVLLSPALSVLDIDSNLQGGLAPDAIVNAVVKIHDFVLGDQLFVNLPTSGGFFIVDDGGGPVVTNISVQSNSLGQLVVSGSDTPGHYALVLDAVNYRSTNPDPQLGFTDRQRTITWQVNDGSAASPLFGAQTPYTTDLGPSGIATGDLNGDGALDLVTANFNDSISVLLGSTVTPGTFGAATNFTASTSPSSILLADFDHSDTLDVVVTTGTTVSILVGAGNGAFAPQADYAAGTGASALAAADFDHDGNLDLAVANSGGGDVSILLGNGGGGFAAPVNFATGAGPSGVVIGDFNRDGFEDLAVSNKTINNVAILLGDGTGNFGAATTFTTGAGTNPEALATADLNGDGFLDIVTANAATGNVSVLLGNGAGSFGGPSTFATTSSTASDVKLADVNADGKYDILVSNSGLSNLSVLLGNGNGTFASAVTFNTGLVPNGLVFGDFNRDGGLDLATSNNSGSASVLLNAGTNMSNVGTTLLAFNAPPTVDLDASGVGLNFANTFTENGAAVAIADTDTIVSDPDDAFIQSVTVTLTNAKAGDSLFLAGGLPGGIGSSINTSVPGVITVTLAGTATPADYETALELIRFSNSSDNPDTTLRDITVVASDGEGTGPTAHANITVVAVNDAPVLSGLTAGVTAPPAAGPKVLSPGAAVSDIDSTTLSSATVHVTGGGFAGENDILAVAAGGLSGTSITAAYNRGHRYADALRRRHARALPAGARQRHVPCHRCEPDQFGREPDTHDRVAAQRRVGCQQSQHRPEHIGQPRGPAGVRLQRRRQGRHPVAEPRRHAGGVAAQRHQRAVDGAAAAEPEPGLGAAGQPERSVEAVARGRLRRFQRRRQVRHPVAARERHAGCVADGRHQRAVDGAAALQSGSDLEGEGSRRLQRRRQGRHPVAERRRHAGGVADERHQRAVDGPGAFESGPELAREGRRRLQRRRQGRHPVAARQRPHRRMADERDVGAGDRRCIAERRCVLARGGRGRLQRRRQGRHPVAERQRRREGVADGRDHGHDGRHRHCQQSGPDLARQGSHRRQRRRQGRHPLAEQRRHAGRVADGRCEPAADRRRAPQSGIAVAHHLTAAGH